MAAQERAKQAQMKQISSDPTVAAAPLMQNQSTTTFLPAPEQVTFNANYSCSFWLLGGRLVSQQYQGF